MKQYDTYKDSGVQWLGKIPGHWECTSLGRVLYEKLQYGASESGDLEYTNDSMRYIRITDITLDGKLKKDCCKYLSSEIGKNYPVRNDIGRDTHASFHYSPATCQSHRHNA